MGNCKIEGINDVSESLKEVKIDNNESNLMNELEGIDYKDKLYKKYRCHNNLRNSQNREYNSKIKNSLLGNKKLNLNNINEKISKEKEDYNDDELIIITPRIKNNNQYCDSNSNEITDEFTIKNETLVYVNDYINNKETEIKKYTNLKQNSNIDKIKGKVQRKKINKNSNIKSNQLNNNKKKKINNIAKNNIKINNNRKQNISKKQKYNSHIPNTNNLDNLTQEMPFVKIDEMEYHRINNKNNNDSKDFQMMNNLNQKTDNYMYKRKEKSKKNSKVFNKSYNNLLFNNFGINPLLDSFQISEIINANNNNPHSSTLQKQNIELKNLLFQQLPLINSEIFLPNVERKTYKEDLEIQNNENQQANIKVPVFRKKTDFHIRNKSYNKYDFFNCNLTNDNCNDNNYFSLFNNSANLSINFIHNKFNKTAKNLNKVEPMINNKNILSDRNNKSCCNKKVNINKNSQNKKPQKKSNPYMNYNNFNNKKNQNKKIKNKSNIQKEKQNVLSTSRSYNNIFQADKNNNKCEFNNTNGNINNMLLPSEQYRDMVEIYLPKMGKRTLICNEIISKPGNKYILSYEKLDNFSIEEVLYDGIIYKVIDNIENAENEYQFLDRYFQITKNSFRYYNNINDAINNKEKPLVQFDIRHIQNIEIIDNSIFGQSKINGNKNINIIFCIYIKDNNDFFVFSHYNKYVGNNIINILEFLIRYYEDNY